LLTIQLYDDNNNKPVSISSYILSLFQRREPANNVSPALQRHYQETRNHDGTLNEQGLQEYNALYSQQHNTIINNHHHHQQLHYRYNPNLSSIHIKNDNSIILTLLNNLVEDFLNKINTI
jgi:hypothetical protein